MKPLIKIQSSGKSKIVADNVKLYRKGSGTVSPPPAGGLSCNILNNVIFLDKETGNFDVRFTTTGDAKRFRAVVANYVPGRTQNGVDASEIELCRLGPDKFDTKRYSLEAPVGVNSATSPQTWRCRWSNGVSAYDPQTDIVEGDYVATVIVYNTSSASTGEAVATCSKKVVTVGSTNLCGNGVRDSNAGEQCDDGNTVSGDGCSSSCRNEIDVTNLIDDPSFDETIVNSDWIGTTGVNVGNGVVEIIGGIGEAILSQSVDVSSVGTGTYTFCVDLISIDGIYDRNIALGILPEGGEFISKEVTIDAGSPTECVSADVTTGDAVIAVRANGGNNGVRITEVRLYKEQSAGMCSVVNPSSIVTLGPDSLNGGSLDIVFTHNRAIGDKFTYTVYNNLPNRNPERVHLCRQEGVPISTASEQRIRCSWTHQNLFDRSTNIIPGVYYVDIGFEEGDVSQANVERCASTSIINILSQTGSVVTTAGGNICNLPGGGNLPVRTRLKDLGDNKFKYCDVDGLLREQKTIGEECSNDFQCGTNLCTDGVCTSLAATTSLLKSVWCALSNPVDFLARDDSGEIATNNDFKACIAR